MPVRATKRGAERTPLSGDFDVVICGASFAGLTVARELAGVHSRPPARVLVLDRYEIGERQTSACAAPTDWLRNLGLEESILQTFDSLLVHTPGTSVRWPIGWAVSTFEYRRLCDHLWGASAAEFETAKVDGRTGTTIHTDRGDVSAPLLVDALGWRRVLGREDNVQPPEALLSRGLEVHPGGQSEDLELWIHKGYVRAGYGWAFPAGDGVRIGVGSFDPRDHVKEPTVRLTEDLGTEPLGYQGNWIPHALRPATEDGVFFVGDSAGPCLPLSGEGIRTAFYFGIAAGREIRATLEGAKPREQALRDYGAFSQTHAPAFAYALALQRTIPRLPPRALTAVLQVMGRERPCRRAFEWYLRVAPPAYVG